MKRRFRIIVWRDGGFWNEPRYLIARNTREVRRRLTRDVGEHAAQRCSVTAISNVGEDAGVLS